MVKKELVNEKNQCCGCGLCALKCPKHAIEMKEDEYGFIYPYVNKSKCINCEICKKECSYNKKTNIEKYIKKTYAAFSKDDIILSSTASGGAFTSIATMFLKNGGVVYGSTLCNEDNNFLVKHIKIEHLEDLEKLKGSKYVQSDITSVYEDIEKELLAGKQVLFSGTPCQVSAIKSFTKNPRNLFTIDIICHGVPNNKLFNDYIEYKNKKEKIKIKNFKFRTKDKGWGLYFSYVFFDLKRNKNITKVEPAFKSSYYQLFLDSFIYRENCYSCPYANDNRVGDITLGDYWGIEIEHSELIKDSNINLKKGISCIIVNSYKGERLVKNYSEIIKVYESMIEKVKKHNNQLNKPSKMPINRDALFLKYKKDGYDFIEDYYNRKYLIKNSIKRVLYFLKNN